MSLFSPKLFELFRRGQLKKNLSNDLLAGVVVGIVAIPLAIAFGVASGVPPEKGIITAVIAGFIISFLGGSRVQIGGPTGAFIIIVFGIIQEYGLGGMMIATIMAGVILVIFGLLKLGVLLKYIPHPLIIGFTSGIALVIFSTQMPHVLGVDLGEVPSSFIGKWGVYLSNLSNLNFYSLGITIITVIIILLSPKITNRIPGSFIAIIIVTIVVNYFLPEDAGVVTIGSLYGSINFSFAPEIPSVDFNNIGHYVAPAVTIAMLGGIESLLSAVVADGMVGSKHKSNTELIAQGIANIVSPLFGGIPATGAIARTATNIKNGGRTPIAGMTHAMVILVIMLFFGKWVAYIPMSCLAGILIVVSYNMSEWRNFVSILKGSIFDVIILLITFLLTVLVDLTVAIQVGVVLASLLFMKRMADNAPKVIPQVDEDLLDGYEGMREDIGVYEISGPFFFASAKVYCEVIRSIGLKSHILILRMRHVPFVDTTGLKNLKDTIKQIEDAGVEVILSGVSSSVFNDLKREGVVKLVGVDNIFSKFDDAIKCANNLLCKVDANTNKE